MFSFNLYKEGLRKSLPLSALFIAIMMLGAVLIPVSNISRHAESIRRGFSPGITVINGFDANPVLIISMIAFAPILTLFLFSFLNKRNRSDFYHSIPHKRESLFASFTAAILTWVIGGIWLCTAVTLIIYAFVPYVIVNITSVLLVMLGLSVGCLLVVAATLIAMSITGGMFSNIITALLILFLPRTIMMTFTSAVIDSVRVIAPESLGILGFINIPFNFMFSAFDGGNIDQLFIRGTLYTVVLAVIYLAIAVILFKRRKSETAGSPAPNKIVQTIIRVLIAFVVCIPATMMILLNARQTHRTDWTGILALYIIAVIAYFAYELITTRKLSNILKALPGLGILVLLNIVFAAGVMATSHVVLNRRIDTDNVAAVRVQTSFSMETMSYEEHRLRELSLEDERLNALLLDALSRNIADIQADTHWFGSRLAVEFEMTRGRTIRRNIWLLDNELQVFGEIMSENEQFRAVAMTLPENPESLWAENLSEEAMRNIYATLLEEVSALDVATWNDFPLNAIPPWQSSSPHNIYGHIEAHGFIRGDTYRSSYLITGLTPRTADMFIHYINAENYENARWYFDELQSSNARWFGASINEYESGGHPRRHSVDTENPEVTELLEQVIAVQRGVPVDRDRAHFSFNFHLETHSGEFVQGVFFFNSADSELLDMLDGR
ncbi:MAG: hypothetical protein FWC96_00540 [Oscillospiraceae bacterium]|nr:hypothetical protein [Oscillospiraceae bacterium]